MSVSAPRRVVIGKAIIVLEEIRNWKGRFSSLPSVVSRINDRVAVDFDLLRFGELSDEVFDGLAEKGLFLVWILPGLTLKRPGGIQSTTTR